MATPVDQSLGPTRPGATITATDQVPPSTADGEQRSSLGMRRAAARRRNGVAYTRRRADIIAAAAAVFRSKGYHASTLVDVSEAVGVDRASLYFYVASKEEIFEEIVTDLVEANVVAVELIMTSAEPAPSKVRRLVTQVMTAYAESYPFLYVYLQENLANVPAERQEWAAKLRRLNRRYEKAVKAIVQQGIDDGSLREVGDLSVVAFGLMGMVSWTHRWFNPERSALSAQAIGDTFASMLLTGLSAHAEELPMPRSPAEQPTPHPDVVAVTERFTAAGVPTYDTLTVPAARAQLEAVTKLQSRPEPVSVVEDILLEGPAGALPARVYRPSADHQLPLVVYLHGGGWVLGSIRAADSPCRALANLAQCVVVSVDYRRAPETKFPGPLEDCVAAIRWLARHRAELGCTDRLVLLGDSAGGNLAAAASAVLRGDPEVTVSAQVLLYPTLAPASTTDFGSYRSFADGPLMTRRELDWFWDHYLRDSRDATDPLAAPLHAPDLAGLPETTVVVAQLDPLRDEGRAYAERLDAAGVPVRLIEIAGAAHGFWWMDRVMSQAGELTAQLAPLLRGPS